MTITFDAVAIDCSDPVALARFWAQILYFELMADDLEEAAARVESLGAGRTGETHAEFGFDWIIFRDPEGNEFCVIHG